MKGAALVAVAALSVWLGLSVAACFTPCRCAQPEPLRPGRFQVVDSTLPGFVRGVVDVAPERVQVRYTDDLGPQVVELDVVGASP